MHSLRMTRRRALLGFTSVAVLAGGPLGASKQFAVTREVPRVGWLGAEQSMATWKPADAFRQGLQDLGYIDGQNIEADYRFAKPPTEEQFAARSRRGVQRADIADHDTCDAVQVAGHFRQRWLHE